MEKEKAGGTGKSVRVLVVDDYEPWHGFISMTLRNGPEREIIGHLSDGLEAVQQAQELQPDLILLDIGLPTLNGIEAARRIRHLSPTSKILFVSANRSADIAWEALSTGAGGYVIKSDAAGELLPAVAAVLQGKRFVSAAILARHNFGTRINDRADAREYCHEVAFYADDVSLVDGYARFIEAALKVGNAVIVVVTQTHRASLVPRLEADGVDVAAANKQGSFILLDAADTLTKLTANDMPDAVRCAKVVGDLIMEAARGVKGAHAQVVVYGEIAPTLLSKGNVEGTIKLEHLWDEITRSYGVHTLCGYLLSAFPDKEQSPIFNRLCTEHSAVYGR